MLDQCAQHIGIKLRINICVWSVNHSEEVPEEADYVNEAVRSVEPVAAAPGALWTHFIHLTWWRRASNMKPVNVDEIRSFCSRLKNSYISLAWDKWTSRTRLSRPEVPLLLSVSSSDRGVLAGAGAHPGPSSPLWVPRRAASPPPLGGTSSERVASAWNHQSKLLHLLCKPLLRMRISWATYSPLYSCISTTARRSEIIFTNFTCSPFDSFSSCQPLEISPHWK